MSDEIRDDGAGEQAQREDELERTRQLILERRNRFMAAALAGIGMAAPGCTRATVCLDVPVNAGGGVTEAGRVAGGAGTVGRAGGTGGQGGSGGARPNVCLSGGTTAPETCSNGRPPPCVCLEPPFDAGTEEDGG